MANLSNTSRFSAFMSQWCHIQIILLVVIQLIQQTSMARGCLQRWRVFIVKNSLELLQLSLFNFNEDNIPITLYVYNHDYDILRPVTVNLSRSWGTGYNRGILGCDVGYGLLHRIPEVVGKFDNNCV